MTLMCIFGVGCDTLPQLLAVKERGTLRAQKPSLPREDISFPVKGMYRLLDLITEQGTNGLSDSFFLLDQFLRAHGIYS